MWYCDVNDTLPFRSFCLPTLLTWDFDAWHPHPSQFLEYP